MKDFKDSNILDEMLDKNLSHTLEEEACWQGDEDRMWKTISQGLQYKSEPLWRKKRTWAALMAAALVFAALMGRGLLSDMGTKTEGNMYGKQQIIKVGGRLPIGEGYGTTPDKTGLEEGYAETDNGWKTGTETVQSTLEISLSQQGQDTSNPIMLNIKYTAKENITIASGFPVIEIYSLDDRGKKVERVRSVIQYEWSNKSVTPGVSLEAVKKMENSLQAGDYSLVYRFRYIHNGVQWEILDQSISFTVIR